MIFDQAIACFQKQRLTMKIVLSRLLVISLTTCIPLSLCAPSYEEKLFGIVVKEQECAKKCSFNSDSQLLHNQNSFIQSINKLIRDNDMSLVKSNRIRATAMLTKAAIMTCQGGDIVETGVFTGGSSATIMKVLMDFDRCNRTFWAFDSFEGR